MRWISIEWLSTAGQHECCRYECCPDVSRHKMDIDRSMPCELHPIVVFCMILNRLIQFQSTMCCQHSSYDFWSGLFLQEILDYLVCGLYKGLQHVLNNSFVHWRWLHQQQENKTGKKTCLLRFNSLLNQGKHCGKVCLLLPMCLISTSTDHDAQSESQGDSVKAVATRGIEFTPAFTLLIQCESRENTEIVLPQCLSHYLLAFHL